MNRSFSYLSLLALSLATLCLPGRLVAQESEAVTELFSQLDANQDAQVSREEAFSTDHPLTSFTDLQQRVDQRFAAADTDQDGTLSVMELEQAPATFGFLRWLRFDGSELRHRFQQSDADSSGKISREELLASVEPDQHHETNRWLTILDFDGDGELSFAEYVLLPQHTPREFYFGVPDPIREAGVAEIVSARNRFSQSDRDGDQQLNATEWQEFSTEHFLAAMFEAIDLNKDQQITLAELETGLNVAFGITDAQGTLLGHSNGQIFSWRRFIEEIDFDRDLKISRSEVSDRFPHSLSLEEQDALFISLDLNQDQHLDSTEFALAGNLRVPMTWIDLVDKFSETDVDLDGLLSLEEFRERVPPWEQTYIASIFPTYDLNGDGQISLMEYRGMPLGTFSLLWMDQRDANGDGSLSLEEFHTRPGLPFLGVSNFFLTKLDTNQDGKLSWSEYQFPVDFMTAPIAVILEVCDSDGNKKISMEELFNRGTARSILDEVMPSYDILFSQCDLNSDGELDEEELESDELARSLVLHLEQLSRTIAPDFSKMDSNQDGRLSREEWKAAHGGIFDEITQQNWNIFDFDNDGLLSFAEYIAQPHISPLNVRVMVADPIAQAGREFIATSQSAFAAADVDHDNQLSEQEWKAFANSELFREHRAKFDLDHNNFVSLDELTRGLEVAFGLRDFSGTPLRKENGEVFNWRGNIEEIDLDRNLEISYSEHVNRTNLPQSDEQKKELFAKLDRDQNQRLTVQELASAGGEILLNSWRDPIWKFKKSDVNRDGFLTLDELIATIESWESKYVESIIPAYDSNKDGKISFVEFRASPLSNLTLIWMDQTDSDGDGFITLKEFHPRDGLPYLGVSKIFFDKLDKNRDGFLDTSEYRFPLNLSKIPTNMAFNIFDANRDSVIDSSEYLQESLKSLPHNLSDYDRQSAVMKMEEAFRYADRNRDGQLEYEEFRNSQKTMGMTAPTERQIDPIILNKYTPKKANQAADSNFNWYVFGGINLLIWLLIGWWLLQPKKTSKPSETTHADQAGVSP